jgi:hypothetical protein
VFLNVHIITDDANGNARMNKVHLYAFTEKTGDVFGFLGAWRTLKQWGTVRRYSLNLMGVK